MTNGGDEHCTKCTSAEGIARCLPGKREAICENDLLYEACEDGSSRISEWQGKRVNSPGSEISKSAARRPTFTIMYLIVLCVCAFIV